MLLYDRYNSSDGVRYVVTKREIAKCKAKTRTAKENTMGLVTDVGKAETRTVKEIVAEIRTLASEFSAIADKCKHYDRLQNVCCYPPTVNSCKWDACPRGAERVICSVCGKG